MPFWMPYDKQLKSAVADVSHISEGSFAGSVIAALFLKRFVRNAKRFAHLDIFGWVPAEQPGRPKGGEPQGARVFHFFAESSKDRDRRRPTRSAPPCLSTTSRPSRCAGASRRGASSRASRARSWHRRSPLRREPRFDATLDTEALRGELVTVYDESEGWAWVQLSRDGYVGYVPGEGLTRALVTPTHRISALRTYLPRARRQDAAACAAQSQCGHRRAAQGGEVPRPRRRRLCRCEPRGAGWPNPISSPWRRRSSARPIFGAAAPRSGPTVRGLCSSRSRPRAALPPAMPTCRRKNSAASSIQAGALCRGDLVFWEGHVGIMTSGKDFLHANAFHMAVAAEPFAQAKRRIKAAGYEVSCARRLRGRQPA